MEKYDNVALAREFVRKVQEEGRLDLLDRYVHPSFRNHTAGSDLSPDRAGVHNMMTAVHNAFEDIKIDIVH